MMKIMNSKQRLFATLALLITGFSSFAQDGGGDGLDVDVQIGEDAQMWYQNPLYWVIGALLLIVLIAVLTRSGGSNNNS